MAAVRQTLLPTLVMLTASLCGCGDADLGLQPEGASADLVGDWERADGEYLQQLSVGNDLRGRWLVRDHESVLDTEDYRYWINGEGHLVSQYEVTLLSFCEDDVCEDHNLPNRQTGTYFSDGYVFNPESYIRQGEGGMSKTGVYQAEFRSEAVVDGQQWLTRRATATLMLGRDGNWRNEVEFEIFVHIHFDEGSLKPVVLRSPRYEEQVWSGRWRDNGDTSLTLFHTPVDGESQITTLHWRPGVVSFRPFYTRPK